jgi:uncharacterized protein with PIN domain
MVLDTSALLAILLGEPEAAAIAQAIANDPRRLLSAVSVRRLADAVEAGFARLVVKPVPGGGWHRRPPRASV